MSTNRQQRAMSLLADIKNQLAVIQSHMEWMITAEKRFSIGQRVEWSRKGRASGFPRRKACQKGIIKKIDMFAITVRLDGLKTEQKYHHAFFNPVSGPKLF